VAANLSVADNEAVAVYVSDAKQASVADYNSIAGSKT
jgi:hypothetical protein